MAVAAIDTPEPFPLQSGSSGSYLSSQFARSSGDIDQALAYLQRVHKQNPKNDDITRQLLGVAILAGKLEVAIPLAEKTYAGTQKEPVALLLSAVDAIKKGKLNDADRLLSQDFIDGRDQLWLPLVKGWLDAERKQLKKPLTVESLSAPMGNASAIVQYHLALINNDAGFTFVATQNFKDALASQRTPPQRMLEMFHAFYERQNKPESLRELATQFPLLPDEKPAQLVSGAAQGVAEVLLTMGSIMQTAGILQDSIIYLQMAHYLHPKLTVASYALAESYERLKLYPQAAAAYASIPADDRLHARAQLRIAIGLERAGKMAQSIAMLEKLQQTRENAVNARIVKGDIYRIHQRFEEAIAAYSDAISKRNRGDEPQDWGVYFARGGCYERLGRWGNAEADLRTALSLAPDQPEVLNYLGYTMLTRGENIAEAKAMLEKAIEKRPNDAAIIDSYGWALYLTGEYEQAMVQLERAIDLMPNDASIYEHLGDVYWQLERKTEARYQWERALIYKPDDAQRASIEDKLKNGLPLRPSAKPSALSAVMPPGKQTSQE